MWEKIEAALRAEQARILEIAERCADEFWAAHMENRDDTDRRGRLGLRVKPGATGVSAQWFHASFYRKPGGANGVKYDYIPLKGEYRHKPRAFAGVRAWEKKLALQLEETLGHVRAQSDALVRISKMVKQVDRRREEFERLHHADEDEE